MKQTPKHIKVTHYMMISNPTTHSLTSLLRVIYILLQHYKIVLLFRTKNIFIVNQSDLDAFKLCYDAD